MKTFLVWLILWALATMEGIAAQQEEENDELEEMVTVALRQGAITANKESLDDGDEDSDNDRFFYRFKGIPYALPPVGGLRFRDPVPPTGWAETRDGSVSPPLCPQLDTIAVQEGIIEVRGDEDCLYLNVYTPTPYASNLPVMVWIHGGAFISGGAEEYAPLALLSKDIVLVSIQYRLGTLGFLSTQDLTIPGNFGLKDQTLALRWVKNNIKEFGGDPNRITLIGQGSGAAAVHFQILSPMAKGLFNRAILQSGSALSPWALRRDHLKVAHTVGLIYNCPGVTENPASVDSAALLYCLQSLALDELVVLPSYFTKWQNAPIVMVPRVDGNCLPADPTVLLKTGRYNGVDIISGYTQHEGALALLPILLDESLGTSILDDFQNIAPVLLNTEGETVSPKVAENIYQFYMGNNEITLDSAQSAVQMLSDASTKVTQDEVALLHSAKCHVFAYELQHRGKNSILDLYGSTVGENWVSHADDLQYLFTESPYFPPLERSDDKRVRDLITTMWTNFAATGYPTPDGSLGFVWVAASPTCLRYLAITTYPYLSNYGRHMITDYWRSLPLRRNRNLFPKTFSFRMPFTHQRPPPVSTCPEPAPQGMRRLRTRNGYITWFIPGTRYRLRTVSRTQTRAKKLPDV